MDRTRQGCERLVCRRAAGAVIGAITGTGTVIAAVIAVVIATVIAALIGPSGAHAETVYKSHGADGAISYGMTPEDDALRVETLRYGPYAAPRVVPRAAPRDEAGQCALDARQTLLEIQHLLALQERAGVGAPLPPLPPQPSYGYGLPHGLPHGLPYGPNRDRPHDRLHDHGPRRRDGTRLFGADNLRAPSGAPAVRERMTPPAEFGKPDRPARHHGAAREAPIPRSQPRVMPRAQQAPGAALAPLPASPQAPALKPPPAPPLAPPRLPGVPGYANISTHAPAP